MLPTINLYDDFSRKAYKIKNISVIGMLPSEFVSIKLPCSQYIPEPAFRICHVLS